MTRNSKQQIAAAILGSFLNCKDEEDVKRVSERIMARYDLDKDPFTGLPCTTKEYKKSLNKGGVI